MACRIALTAEALPGDTLPGSRVGPRRLPRSERRRPSEAAPLRGRRGRIREARDPSHPGATMPEPQITTDQFVVEEADAYRAARAQARPAHLSPGVLTGDRSEKIDKII